MNKILAFAWFFITSIALQAQEVSDTVGEPEPYEGTTWTPEVKKWLLIIFSVATIVVVLRTFRGKAEV